MDEDEQKNQNIVITAAEIVNIQAVLDLYIVSVCEHIKVAPWSNYQHPP